VFGEDVRSGTVCDRPRGVVDNPGVEEAAGRRRRWRRNFSLLFVVGVGDGSEGNRDMNGSEPLASRGPKSQTYEEVNK
jgi:hypothetical protein